MSKITGKNLSYENRLPPFLQKLQNANANLDGRHERAIARPRRSRDDQDIEDDAPTYVDEETNHTLTKDEYAALTEINDETNPASASIMDSKKPITHGERPLANREEQVAGIGASKKRKVGKVIRDDGNREGDIADVIKKVDTLVGTKVKAIGASRPPKKGKKIKLCFSDEEG